MMSLDAIEKAVKNTEKEMHLAEGKNPQDQLFATTKLQNEHSNENNKLQFTQKLEKETFLTSGSEIKASPTEKTSFNPQKSFSEMSSDYIPFISNKNSPEPIKKSDGNFERVKSTELMKKKAKKNEFCSRENSSGTDSDSIKELYKEENSSRSAQDSPKIITRTRKLSNTINFFGEDRNLSPRKITQALKGHEKKEVFNSFNDSLPINENTMNDCLKKTKSLLHKKDKKINIMDCEGNPHLQMLIVAQNNMTHTGDTNSKTVILYDKEKIEGKGANAAVFKGYDLINKKNWAIKLLKANKDQRTIEIENLKTRKWLFGCYLLANSKYALIMKFIPGETLLKALYITDDTLTKESAFDIYCTSKKDLNIDFKLELICKLLEQLAKLHKQYGLLHRDIKPDNIHVYYDNRQLKVRIIDLGDAISINARKSGLCGTKGYIDPRIEYTPYDADADIHSLGVVVAEVLTKNNFQQLLKEEVIKTSQLISAPNISFDQLENMMPDVLKAEPTLERYEGYEDHKTNMDNFIFLKLSILARKMLISPLPESFLENEIADLKALREDCRLFSVNIEQLLEHKSNLQNMLNSNNRFFHPELKINMSPIVSEATNYFKLIHSSKEENENKLSI